MTDQHYTLLREKFHFSAFRHGQREIIDALLARQDVLGVMPTGSGKSLCYQLPALVLPGVTLVVSPLIALMKDQVDGLTQNAIAATFINSTLAPDEQYRRIQQTSQGIYKLLYIAPERLRSSKFLEGIKSCAVSLIAVDEAHCLSEWGHDFRPDYLRLKEFIEKLGHPPIAALTATATPEVREDIIKHLGLQRPLTIVTGFDRPNLYLKVRQVSGESEKLEAIRSVLLDGTPCGIIYAATRRAVETVSTALRAEGFRVGTYHAGLSAEERHRVQDQFMQGSVPVVAATNAFGMGIDKADLRFIVHFDIPGSLEAYYQEVGRAGRDGKPATCLLLFNYADTFTQEFFIEGSYPPQAVVVDVYRVLYQMESEEIEITHKALARSLERGKLNEMAIGSALKILEKAGYLERGMEGERLAQLILQVEPAHLREKTGADKTQASVANYLTKILKAGKDRPLPVDLQTMADDLSLNADHLRRLLVAMQQAGYLQYRPPFRGRGLRMLQRVPPSQLKINFSEIERRAQFERQKLRRMVDYAYTSQCLRRFILEYFGERVNEVRCRNCSSCMKAQAGLKVRPLQEKEAAVVKKTLSCVARMKGRYGKMRVTQVLMGSKAQELETLGLNQLSTYGLLKECTQSDLYSIIEAMIAAGMLEVQGTEYPLLKLTDAGREAMAGRTAILMAFPSTLSVAMQTSKRQSVKGVPNSSGLPYSEELFEELRALRLRIAQERKLPPFLIYHDETLRAISRALPTKRDELMAVKGCGRNKVSAFGEQTLEVVRHFLREHRRRD